MTHILISKESSESEERKLYCGADPATVSNWVSENHPTVTEHKPGVCIECRRLYIAMLTELANGLLSVTQCSKLRGVDPRTIRLWIKSGLPAQRIGSQWVVSRADLESYQPEKPGRRWEKSPVP